ncbi:SAF domain-containing protein [Paenibacillus sp. FA6]|uniref:SAF domain-containing protein n=1 Tax=Paenibacillus sp. FA6 TaxID=3413029 RepID=UPI003F65D898
MSKIRQRTKNLIVAGLVGAISMGIVASGGAIYMINQQANDQRLLRVDYESKLKEAEKLLQDQQAIMEKVVVTSKELPAGVELTEEDLKIIQIPETEAPANMVHSKNDLIGKILKIDVGVNTPVMNSIVFEEGVTPNDLRAQEYNVMELPTQIRKGQFVDVRISFPTGEDFIVLSKKKVNDVSVTTVWYNVNESEILAMSSATVDAYLNSAKIYATTYVDPFMQDKAIENYPVNLQVIDLIESDPNVLVKASEQLKKSVRRNLELNLSEMNETDKVRIENGDVILQQRVANNQLTNQKNNNTNQVPIEEIDVFEQSLVK